MPATKQTKRFRGNQRLLLRRLIKVVKEFELNNSKYPGGPAGDRNYLLDPETMTNLGLARVLAAEQLNALWPILVSV